MTGSSAVKQPTENPYMFPVVTLALRTHVSNVQIKTWLTVLVKRQIRLFWTHVFSEYMSWSPCLPGWLEVRPHVLLLLCSLSSSPLSLSAWAELISGSASGPRTCPDCHTCCWSTWFTEHDLRWRFCDHVFLVHNIPGPDLRATEWRSASGVEARVTEEECGEIKEECHVCVDFSPSFLTDPRSPGPPHTVYITCGEVCK